MEPESLTSFTEEPTTHVAVEHSTTHHEFKHGFVKFDYPVCVPGLGNFRVKSEIPRLKHKYERKLIADHDMETLCSNLMVWANENYDTDGREGCFKKVALTSILISAYAHPIPDLRSEEMSHCFKFFFWSWYIDDTLEDAIENKIHFKQLKCVVDQFQSIWADKYDKFTENFEHTTNYPALDQLFDSILQLHKLWKKTLPNYEHRVKKFANALQLWFDALIMSSVDKIDGRYTEETFKAYRKNVAGAEPAVEFFALIHGVVVSDAVSKSLTMKRLIEALNGIVSFSNDVLGMKKDFAKGHTENLIIFIMEKKVPLEVAVRRVCEIIASEMIDYDLLKKAILKEFDHDDNLIKYLDILDSFIDGHNMLYASPRYHSRGLVTLSDP